MILPSPFVSHTGSRCVIAAQSAAAGLPRHQAGCGGHHRNAEAHQVGPPQSVSAAAAVFPTRLLRRCRPHSFTHSLPACPPPAPLPLSTVPALHTHPAPCRDKDPREDLKVLARMYCTALEMQMRDKSRCAGLALSWRCLSILCHRRLPALLYLSANCGALQHVLLSPG